MVDRASYMDGDTAVIVMGLDHLGMCPLPDCRQVIVQIEWSKDGSSVMCAGRHTFRDAKLISSVWALTPRAPR